MVPGWFQVVPDGYVVVLGGSKLVLYGFQVIPGGPWMVLPDYVCHDSAPTSVSTLLPPGGGTRSGS